jgi:Mg-chelatase subunit ChlD
MDEAAGGATKLDAAKAAARQFLRLLDPVRDQAAVVAFHGATSLAPLSSDRPALEAAIDAIRTQPGTRVDRALDVAAAELFSGRARPGSNRVLVLLTDGRTDEGTAPGASARAAEARSLGAQIYAIGLGDQVDETFLRQLASGPDFYLYAPQPSALETLYERIAAELPCPGGAVLPSP